MSSSWLEAPTCMWASYPDPHAPEPWTPSCPSWTQPPNLTVTPESPSFEPPVRTPKPTSLTQTPLSQRVASGARGAPFGRRAISLAPVSYPTAGHTTWPSTHPFSVEASVPSTPSGRHSLPLPPLAPLRVFLLPPTLLGPQGGAWRPKRVGGNKGRKEGLKGRGKGTTTQREGALGLIQAQGA